MVFAAVDIGNTRIKVGLYDTSLVLQESFLVSAVAHVCKFLASNAVTSCYISSVVPSVGENLTRFCLELGIASKILTFCDIPLALNVANPAEVGVDRIVNSFATSQFAKNAVIISAGTALVCDLLEDGVFQGGIIAPGYQMLQKSLHHFTSTLPLVNSSEFSVGIGKTSQEAISNGCNLAFNGVIRGFTDQFDYAVFKTGGDMDKVKIGKPVPNLTLDGIFNIYQYDNSNGDN